MTTENICIDESAAENHGCGHQDGVYHPLPSNTDHSPILDWHDIIAKAPAEPVNLRFRHSHY